MYKPNCLKCILLIVCCCHELIAAAEVPENQGPVFYNLNIHHGKMMPHNPELATLNRENINGIELNTWFYNKNKINLNNPVLGVGYLFSNLGNNEVLGNIHAAYMAIKSPYLPKNLPVQLKIALGPAYLTKKHDPQQNPLNEAIGSHLNAYGQISLTGSIPLVKGKWFLRSGISFHHMSNRKIVSPNSGINLLTFHAGLELRSAHKHSDTLVIEREKEIRNKK